MSVGVVAGVVVAFPCEAVVDDAMIGTEVVVTGVAVVVPVVVVDGLPGAVTEMLPETPKMPEELSVTRSVVVSGSTRVTLTVASPAVKFTALPAVQLCCAG